MPRKRGLTLSLAQLSTKDYFRVKYLSERSIKAALDRDERIFYSERCFLRLKMVY